jgi:hypothetical protein
MKLIKGIQTDGMYNENEKDNNDNNNISDLRFGFEI